MTRAEAIKQALQNLTVLDAISEPAAEDAATVGVRLDNLTDEMKERGLCWWDADSIPASVANPFCDLVAAESAASFGKSYDPGKAMSRIAALKSGEKRAPVKAEYF